MADNFTIEELHKLMKIMPSRHIPEDQILLINNKIFDSLRLRPEEFKFEMPVSGYAERLKYMMPMVAPSQGVLFTNIGLDDKPSLPVGYTWDEFLFDASWMLLIVLHLVIIGMCYWRVQG